ncbi:hypothetical protein PG996_002992 [Apiospora saccharicola]|uniref:Uncharacterized protein n=1 Tax=Apiospora saccharicola TaxID=335842 RepID=A0ABR1W194_9PEZI
MATEPTPPKHWARESDGKIPGLRNVKLPLDDSKNRIILYLWDLYRVGNGLPADYRAERDASLYRLFARGMTELMKRAPRGLNIREWADITSDETDAKKKSDGPKNRLFSPDMDILQGVDHEDALRFVVDHIDLYREADDEPCDPLGHPFIRMLCPRACELRAQKMGRQLGTPDNTVLRPISDPEKRDRPEWRIVRQVYLVTNDSNLPLPLSLHRSTAKSEPSVCCGDLHYAGRNYESNLNAAVDFAEQGIKKIDRKKVLRLFAVLEDMYRTHKVPANYDAALDRNLWDFNQRWSSTAMELITGWERTDIDEALLCYKWVPRTQSNSPEAHIESFFSDNQFDNCCALRSVAKACIDYFGPGPLYAQYLKKTDAGVPWALHLYKTKPERDLDISVPFKWRYDPRQDRFLRLLFPRTFTRFLGSVLPQNMSVQAPEIDPVELQKEDAGRFKLYPLFHVRVNCVQKPIKFIEGYNYETRPGYPPELYLGDQLYSDQSSADSDSDMDLDHNSEQDTLIDDSELEDIAGIQASHAKVPRRSHSVAERDAGDVVGHGRSVSGAEGGGRPESRESGRHLSSDTKADDRAVKRLPLDNQAKGDRKRKASPGADVLVQDGEEGYDGETEPRKSQKSKHQDGPSSASVAVQTEAPLSARQAASMTTDESSSLQSLQREVAELRRRNTKLEADADLRQVRTEYHNDLERQFKKTQGERDALQHQLRSAQDKIQATQSQLETKTAEVSELTAQLVASKTSIQTLESDLTNLKERISRLETELSAATATNEIVGDENATLKRRVTSLEDDITSLQAEITALKTSIVSFEEEIKSLKETGEILSKSLTLLRDGKV